MVQQKLTYIVSFKLAELYHEVWFATEVDAATKVATFYWETCQGQLADSSQIR